MTCILLVLDLYVRLNRGCGSSNYSVVARCEVHGTAVKPGMKAGEKQYMSAFALNEWDSKLAGGVEWRQKIDTQVLNRCFSGLVGHKLEIGIK